MRILITATLLVLGFLTAARAANDGPWCYRDFGRAQYTNCSYYEVRQCLIVAGTFGGVCERNNSPLPQSRKDRHKTS